MTCQTCGGKGFVICPDGVIEACPSCHGTQEPTAAAIQTQDSDTLRSPARVANMAKTFLIAGVAVAGWLLFRYSHIRSLQDSDALNGLGMPEVGSASGDFSTWEPEA